MKSFLIIAITAILVFAVALGAGADVVFTSYSDTSDSYDTWNNTSPNTELVESFTTGGDSGSWTINLIKLNAYGGGIMGGGSSAATISIYDDNSGEVGALIHSWNVNINSSMGNDFSFTVSGVALDASTDYWFGVEATSSNAVGWRRTESYGTQGATGHVFQIEGTPVPEPGSLVALCGGIIAAAGVIRRRL